VPSLVQFTRERGRLGAVGPRQKKDCWEVCSKDLLKILRTAWPLKNRPEKTVGAISRAYMLLRQILKPKALKKIGYSPNPRIHEELPEESQC